MKIRTLSVLFFIRRSRVLSNQEVPIHLRITVDGEREEVSIRKSIHPSYWNEKGGYVKQTAPNAGAINAMLNQILIQMYKNEKELNDRGKIVTALALKNALFRSDEDDKKMLLQAW